MKKILKTIGVFLLGVSFICGTSQNKAYAHHNVYWGDMQVKKYQIGKVEVKKTINIYKIKNKKLVYYKKAKPKSVYRVFEVDNDKKVYKIESNQYIKMNKSVKYTQMPDSLFDKMLIIHPYATRGTYWGDTQKQVKKVEKAKLYHQDKEFLIYKTKKYGYNANLVYQFKNNKLILVMYSLDLGKKYHSWTEISIIHDSLAKKVKKEEKIKVKGFYYTDQISSQNTSWDEKKRMIFLSINDKNLETRASVSFHPQD